MRCPGNVILTRSTRFFAVLGDVGNRGGISEIALVSVPATFPLTSFNSGSFEGPRAPAIDQAPRNAAASAVASAACAATIRGTTSKVRAAMPATMRDCSFINGLGLISLRWVSIAIRERDES